MKIKHYEQFKVKVYNMLKESISDDYVGYILTSIIGDVIDDVETCADEDYNEDDIRLAIGRTFMNKLGIDT